jgi:alpha-ketoglutaric semialdehyde dehydrogenase
VSKTHSNLVDGRWVADAADHFDDLNPADLDEVVAEVPAMSAEQAVAACEGAALAFDEWRAKSAIDRGEILYRAAGLLRDRVQEVAMDITREMGKTVAESTAEVGGAANFLEYYASFGRQP